LRISTVESVTGLSKSTIYSKLANNEFPQPIRLGTRCTRFRASDVTAWLAAQAK
jgi:prophage regulatory protein